MSSRRLKTVPFANFIRRQKVLSLYRVMQRTGRRIVDEQLRQSVSVQLRTSFKANAHLSDNAAIKACLLEGNRSLQLLQSMLTDQQVVATGEKESSDAQYVVGTDWPWSRKP